MKNLIIIAFIAAATLTSCQKECGEWYDTEDKNCVDMRNKFIGTYNGTFTIGGQASANSTDFSIHPTEKTMFWDGAQYVVLTGSTTFDIPLQQRDENGTLMYFEGNGSISGSQLIMTFTVTVNSQTVPGSFIGNKQ